MTAAASPAGVSVRPLDPRDLDSADSICVLTGHAGADARPHYRGIDVLPALFVRPYVAADPTLTWVAEHDGRVGAYLVATADTAGFVDWWRAEWLPVHADRFPSRPVTDGDWDATMAQLLHRPERLRWPELAEHPAHLHLNVHPEAQGHGLGRLLLQTLLAELRAREVPGVHAAHGRFNVAGRQFYRRFGFTRVAVPDPDPVTYVGRTTQPLPVDDPSYRPARRAGV